LLSTEIVNVITNDGRNIVGVLRGFDQTLNLVLNESHERVYSPDDGVTRVALGLYVIRGDNVAVIGEVDEDLELAIDLEKVRGETLNPVVH
jgi:U6 snRNA-associated Sm-like protein LSm8